MIPNGSKKYDDDSNHSDWSNRDKMDGQRNSRNTYTADDSVATEASRPHHGRSSFDIEA